MTGNAAAERHGPTPGFPSRLLPAAVIVAFTAAGLSLRGLSSLYTDFLWFQSLDFTSTWTTIVGTRVAIAGIATALVFTAVLSNAVLAERLAPPGPFGGPGSEVVQAYGSFNRLQRGIARVGVAAAAALVTGAGAAVDWEEWILFRHSVDFGVADPELGADIGFYVLRLPFLEGVVGWLFSTILVVLLVTAGTYYVTGCLRPVTFGQRLTDPANTHLSILAGTLALVKGVDYFLQRFELMLSRGGVVDGAKYADVHARLPALNLLVVLAGFAAVLFFANAVRRGWILPLTAVVLWGVVAGVASVAYPAFLQRLRVEPAESSRERPYIERNIAATRSAMGLGDVRVNLLDYREDLAAVDLVDNEETIRNVRLWDPAILQRTYQRLQEIRGFYQFNDVDVDRYEVDGRLTQIVLSARELNPEGLPSQSWENRHLGYTHGYGAVLSPANAVTADGQPAFLVKDIPPRGSPTITRPELYYGEQLPGYAVVRTERPEVDYPLAEGDLATARYDGRGGVKLTNHLRRLAFALRFGDLNPLISGLITSDSRILYLRDVRQRARTAAPFLAYDGDPYPIIVGGRVLWIQDAYTTTDRYPYAQRAPTDRLAQASGLHRGFNYVRNSVKVVVDAYHGSADFYVVDEGDPLIQVYRKAFPRLFRDGSTIPETIRRQLRYPEDLFRVQSEMWGFYHIGDPDEFYSRSDAWDISQDPGSGEIGRRAATTPTPAGPTGVPAPAAPRREPRMDPYYLLMRLPGEEREEFIFMQPFVPTSRDDSRKELAAFMVAKMDPGRYGELEVFTMPRDRQVDGPAIVNARIQQDESISSLITLLSQGGSRVLQGNLLVIPVNQSLLYVRPLYVEAEGTRVPELRKVIVVYADRVVMRDSLREALAAVFGDAPETLEQGSSTEEGEDPERRATETAEELLGRANEAFAEAEDALRDFRLDVFQQRYQEGRRLLEQARAGLESTAPLRR